MFIKHIRHAPFLADDEGLRSLPAALKPTPSAKGGNVIATLPKGFDVFEANRPACVRRFGEDTHALGDRTLEQ